LPAPPASGISTDAAIRPEGAGMTTDSIAFAKPEDVGISRERLAMMSEVLKRDVEAGKLPGAVTLVGRHGRIVHFKAIGSRDPASGAPMELDAIFRIYSMTKPIVSIAVMQLVEEGLLRLSDPLAAYLPAFAEMRVFDPASGPDGVPAARPITIHDLLRHTSGLTYEFMAPDALAGAYVNAQVSRYDQSNAEQSAALARLPLIAHPGARWDYGRSTDVLGRVIEVVTGQTLGQALEERVLAPLAMVDTGFRLPPEKLARLAEPFATDPDSGAKVGLLDLTRDIVLENGGGGLVSTAADYARFMHMLGSGGSFEGTRIIGPKTLAFMASDHLGPEVSIGSDLLPPGYGFGLGFAVRRAAGLAPFPGSAGDVYWEGIAGTTFWIDPSEGLYALLMIQAPGRREHYRRTFRSLVYAALTA
jgi:CubicO group peptidase (beta-lactamase class C family)